jgi:hypothetical protein
MSKKSNIDLEATPLKRCRHKKGWRLVRVKQELIDKGTPISYPVLLTIEHGYKVDKAGKKLPYKPGRRTLADLGKLFKKKPEDMYEDRSKS